MPPPAPILEFNYDISCPFAYIASTRVQSLAARTGATLHYRPVLLGAIYRATSAPQGAAGSASDVFNAAKKSVTSVSMGRTLRRYRIAYNPPPEHPRKSVNALRLLYAVPDGPQRAALTDALFAAYWAQRRDVTDTTELLRVAAACGITGLSAECFSDTQARAALEDATTKAIDRGAFGVPGFWIADARWTDRDGVKRQGRFFWGQDRMHFVEATLLSLRKGAAAPWSDVPRLAALIPRCVPSDALPAPTRLEFWFDFSSPWAYLGYTQLGRLQALFGPRLEIVLKPFLLGILFREIGAPMLPMAAVSVAKRKWVQQDHADWVAWWSAVALSSRRKDGQVEFQWASVFPIRTPEVLRVAIVELKTIPVLCMLSSSPFYDRSLTNCQTQPPGPTTPTSPLPAFSHPSSPLQASTALISSHVQMLQAPKQHSATSRRKQNSLASVVFRLTVYCVRVLEASGSLSAGSFGVRMRRVCWRI
jgi:2-hydroxychromene-2-carboxylate isomerase